MRGGGSEEGGRVLWDATSRSLCGRVGPPRTTFGTLDLDFLSDDEAFGLWRLCFPPVLVRPDRRLLVQVLSEGSLGCRDLVPGGTCDFKVPEGPLRLPGGLTRMRRVALFY